MTEPEFVKNVEAFVEAMDSGEEYLDIAFEEFTSDRFLMSIEAIDAAVARFTAARAKLVYLVGGAE